LFWISGLITFGVAKGSHPIAASVFLFAWLLGFAGGALAVAGLFKDESKWPSVLALVVFPFSILVAV
jgi:hypothetical protein